MTEFGGRQISPGTFSGNAVKSPDIPVKSPEKINFSGSLAGAAHF
jgi:hypothetical protein